MRGLEQLGHGQVGDGAAGVVGAEHQLAELGLVDALRVPRTVYLIHHRANPRLSELSLESPPLRQATPGPHDRSSGHLAEQDVHGLGEDDIRLGTNDPFDDPDLGAIGAGIAYQEGWRPPDAKG